MKLFFAVLLCLLSFGFIQHSVAQTVQTVNTTSATACDGSATLVSPPASPWTWEWFHYGNSTAIQSGGLSLTNMCSSGLNYYVEFSAPGQTSYTVPFYIYDNCFGFSMSTGSNSTAADECTGYIIGYFVGGIAPYNVSWSNGSSNDTLSQLCADTYSFVATDSQGCENFGSIPIGVDSSFSSFLSIGILTIAHDDIQPSCTGSISLQPDGGSPPYFVTWSNGPVAYQYTNPNLCPGVYSVSVADASGETIVDTITIYNSNVIYSTNPFPDSTIIDNLDLGLVEICVIDFATIDTVYLYNATFDSLNQIAILTWVIVDAIDSTFYTDSINLSALNGVYQIIIGFYCSQKSMGNFVQCKSHIYLSNGSIHLADLSENILMDISAYPNPFDEVITLKAVESDEYTVRIIDVKGQVVFQKDYTSVSTIQCNGLGSLHHGIYFISVESKRGKRMFRMVH